MNIKKVIGYLLLFIGLYFIYGTFHYSYKAITWKVIKKYGETVMTNVVFVDCEDDSLVKFKIRNEETIITQYLDSDCSSFKLGEEQSFLHYDSIFPNEYVFPNDHISPFAIIFSIIMCISFLMPGIILIKRKPATNKMQ